MALNTLTTNPPKIIILDPKTGTARRVFVFIGDVPKNIRDAVHRVTDARGKPNADAAATLKGFYGSDWMRHLAIEYTRSPTQTVKFGGAEGVSSAVYGEDGVYSEVVDVNVDDVDVNVVDVNVNDVNVNDVDVNVNDDATVHGGNAMLKGIPMTGIKGMNIDDLDIRDSDLVADRSRGARVSIHEDTTLRQVFEPGVTYVDDVYIFPEDRFSELKDKIYLACGIPTYRQHLFYYRGGGSLVQIPYRLYAEGAYTIDIVASFSQAAHHLHGIPVDKNLYVMRDDIKVESYDTFRVLDPSIMPDATVYVVDIDQFIDPVRSRLIEILTDTYQFDLLYYGFVVKFWPQFTKECFYDYIVNERELYQKFPDFAKSKTALKNSYGNEQVIINRNYHVWPKVQAMLNGARSPVTLSITHITITTHWEKNIVNLRNLFDKMRVNRCIPEVYAYVDHDGKKYLLKKRYARNESNIAFPPAFKTGVIIAVSLRKRDQESYHRKESRETTESEQSRYLFLNVRANGRYYVKSIWNEEDEYGFEDVLAVTKRFIDPLIQRINQMGKYVLPIDKPLPVITRHNVVYDNMSMGLYWKRIMSSIMFKHVKTLFEEYVYAGIVAIRPTQQMGQFELTFRKGMTEFDPGQIERVVSMANIEMISNHYTYLSNNTIKQKWDQLYDGRVVRLHHRTTDLKFEIVNVKEREFPIIYRYLAVFIHRAICDERLKSLASKPLGDVKKLRKLKEIDPELYNLKKYGSKTLYSIKCQNPNQPVIYTDDEIKQMTAEQRKRLVKYWNFTLKRDAFYGCPNKKYPHLSFKVGIHPKNYCLPCCKKSESSPDSRKAQINNVCLKQHIWVGDEVDADDSLQRHVVTYGKDIEPGRLSKLPTGTLTNLLIGTAGEAAVNRYFIYGVPQSVPSADRVGVLYAVAEALRLAPADYTAKCIFEAKRLFGSLLNGSLIEYFRSPDEFVSTMSDIFVHQKPLVLGHRFDRYEELFVELTLAIYNTGVIMFVDETGGGDYTTVFVHERVRQTLLENTHHGYILIMNRAKRYYPIFVVNPEEYFKNLVIQQRIFSRKDNIITHLVAIVVGDDTRVTASKSGRDVDLLLLKRFASVSGYTITQKYINKRDMCYGVLLTASDRNVYIPCEYIVNVPDGLPVETMVYDGVRHPVRLTDLVDMVDRLNKFISESYKTYSAIVLETALYIDGVLAGVRSRGNPAIFYVSDEDTPSTLPHIDLHYDFNEVNTAIMSREPPIPDNRTRLLGRSLYDNYLYQLFMLEFINYIEKERNDGIRGEIKVLITAADFRKKVYEIQRKLRNILGEYPSDIATLQAQLSAAFYSGDKKSMLSVVDSTVYEFDKLTINRLRKLDNARLVDELTVLTGKFVHFGEPPETVTVPNVYLPCEYSPEMKYCSGKKLIMERTKFDSYVSILASDIMNPVKHRYITSGLFTDNIISYFDFDIHPDEHITVKKL